MEYFPHIDQILRGLRISRERLQGRSRVAVDTRLLRRLIEVLASRVAFSEEFYLANNPDIAAAHARGELEDLRMHFIERGYLEGRSAAPPAVDEAWYIRTYPDVAEAVRRGDVKSGREHYARSGHAEARLPNPDLRPQVESWLSVLQDPASV